MSEEQKYKIDHNIPIPERGVGLISTMRKMKVGDSFLVDIKQRRSLGAAAARSGIKVVVRKDGRYKLRVWRVK